MNENELNKRLAQEAEAWNARQDERQKHLEIMEKLEKFDCERVQCEDSEGYVCSYYTAFGKDEKFFSEVVRRGRHDEIMFLIKRYRHVYEIVYKLDIYRLSKELQSMIAERNDPDEVQEVMAMYEFCPEAQDVMFATWPHQQLVSYAQKYGFCKKWQVYIFQNWPEAEVQAYWWQHDLCLEAEKLLLERGRHEEIMTYIHKYGLYPDLFATLIKRGDHDEIMTLINERSAYFPKDAQSLIVKRNNAAEVQGIMAKYGFCPEAQDVMFATWSHQQLVSYAQKHGFCEKWQVYIFNNWSESEVRAYCLRHGLSLEAWKLLLKRGWHEVIMTQIQVHGFFENLFIALIERGNHEEIMAALTKFMNEKISPESQEALWARGNDEELALLMKAHQLCDSLLERMLGNLMDPATQARFEMYSEENSKGLPEAYQTRFLQEAPHELFLSYILCHGFYESQHKSLLTYRTPDEVRVYLERHRFLSDEAEKILAREGSREDKVFYYQVKAHDKDKFVVNLLKTRPLDYAALSSIFLSFDENRWWSDPKEENLMKTGTPEELKAYFASGNTLRERSFLTLFFRQDRELFEAYLEGKERFY